jgi:hypothetical protein
MKRVEQDTSSGLFVRKALTGLWSLRKEADQFRLFQKRKDRAMNDVRKTPRLRGKHVVVIGGSRGLAVCRREADAPRL